MSTSRNSRGGGDMEPLAVEPYATRAQNSPTQRGGGYERGSPSMRYDRVSPSVPPMSPTHSPRADSQFQLQLYHVKEDYESRLGASEKDRNDVKMQLGRTKTQLDNLLRHSNKERTRLQSALEREAHLRSQAEQSSRRQQKEVLELQRQVEELELKLEAALNSSDTDKQRTDQLKANLEAKLLDLRQQFEAYRADAAEKMRRQQEQAGERDSDLKDDFERQRKQIDEHWQAQLDKDRAQAEDLLQTEREENRSLRQQVEDLQDLTASQRNELEALRAEYRERLERWRSERSRFVDATDGIPLDTTRDASPTYSSPSYRYR